MMLRVGITNDMNAPSTSPPRRKRMSRPWDRDSEVRARNRMVAAVLAGLVIGTGCGFVLPVQLAVLAGWDAAAAAFVIPLWLSVWGLSAAQTKANSVREDPSRAATDVALIAASVASLIGVGAALVKASDAKGSMEIALIAVSALSVALSWWLVHTIFTLRYARLFYAVGHGIDFHQDDQPTYWDFAYVAFTIGMTFQVSDTDLSSSSVRATALRQALLAYLFGVVIVAMMINVVAGLLK
jgi:uncharacterized membrane protein